MSKRIWELDAARGLALAGMLVVHFLYDLTELTGAVAWEAPGWYVFVKNNCGFLFVVISGISATLGSHNLKRGAQVLGCGILCSAVTIGMYLLGIADMAIGIYFGVLHCLGVCMMLWSILKKWPSTWLVLAALPMIALGLAIAPHAFPTGWWLVPLGFCPEWYVSSDYFPLLPNLGFFLLGACLGRRLYPEKKTRLPGLSPIRPLCWLGQNSLWIYLLHQPVLLALTLGLRQLIRG